MVFLVCLDFNTDCVNMLAVCQPIMQLITVVNSLLFLLSGTQDNKGTTKSLKAGALQDACRVKTSGNACTKGKFLSSSTQRIPQICARSHMVEKVKGITFIFSFIFLMIRSWTRSTAEESMAEVFFWALRRCFTHSINVEGERDNSLSTKYPAVSCPAVLFQRASLLMLFQLCGTIFPSAPPPTFWRNPGASPDVC